VLLIGLVALGVAGVSRLCSGGTQAAAARTASAERAAGQPTTRPGAAATPVFAGSWLSAHPEPDLGVHGQAGVLVDVHAHQVVWAHAAHTPRAPASLTKLVTAMVAADLAPMDKQIRVTDQTDAAAVQKVEPASTVMGLTAGEVLTERELLYGLFMRSGNDAAETLGSGIVPRDRFIQLMNQKAAQLHMADSHFTTPVGLDDPEMKTTPYDLAVAAANIAVRYPELLAISGTPAIQLPQTASHKAFDMVNYNKLVIPGTQYTYQGASGMKTAFTDNAGPCMVATASRNGRLLVAVVMDSDNFFADAIKLFDYGFSQPVK
jgi:D-alanyl-D-alanine carboxypeptidase